jgi:hypothetical protein
LPLPPLPKAASTTARQIPIQELPPPPPLDDFKEVMKNVLRSTTGKK